jgi:hypothetical protein
MIRPILFAILLVSLSACGGPPEPPGTPAPPATSEPPGVKSNSGIQDGTTCKDMKCAPGTHCVMVAETPACQKDDATPAPPAPKP